jgi:hypothetical protein
MILVRINHPCLRVGRHISPIGHVYAELELEVSTKQVQVKDFTNLVLTQGKPRCINQCSLSFILTISLCFT